MKERKPTFVSKKYNIPLTDALKVLGINWDEYGQCTPDIRRSTVKNSKSQNVYSMEITVDNITGDDEDNDVGVIDDGD